MTAAAARGRERRVLSVKTRLRGCQDPVSRQVGRARAFRFPLLLTGCHAGSDRVKRSKMTPEQNLNEDRPTKRLQIFTAQRSFAQDTRASGKHSPMQENA